MERTKQKEQSPVSYNVHEEPIVLSKALLDTLLKQKKDSANLIALYCFYYRSAKYQGTNQPWCTKRYVAEGLSWTEDKVRRMKTILKELGLIKDVLGKDSKNGKFSKPYIRLNLIWTVDPPGVEHRREDSTPVNALNPITKTNMSNSNDSANINFRIVPNLFETFWKLYPKHPDKGKAKTSWDKICKKLPKERPTWKQLRNALKLQKQSERWQDIKFIPHPTTWLNQSRWLDDPEEMKSFNRETDNKPKNIMRAGELWYLRDNGKYYNDEGIPWIE